MTMNQFQEVARQVGTANAQARRALEAAAGLDANVRNMQGDLQRLLNENVALKSMLERTQMTRQADPKIQYVENIPGRRVPWDMTVDIPIAAGVNGVQQGTVMVSQEGPFVAVARYATLLSQHQFQFTAPTTSTTVTFQSRSYGRYRPIHSAWDIMDGRPVTQVTEAVSFPGTGAPHVINPSNESAWRSMEGDFRIQFVTAGSSYPRGNQPVPSTFWTTQINSPFNLGALDVFERGEVLTFNVLPLHVNNPPYGNVSSFGVPNANFPFIDSQWDADEGISDPNLTSAESTDPVIRLPNAILTIGFHGYRISQPPGAGPY